MNRLPHTTQDVPRRATVGTLWRPEDVLAAAIPCAIGVAAWAVAWFQISGQSSYSKQIGWADLGVAGLIVATTSQLIWLLRGRRTVGEMRRQLLRVHVSAAPKMAPVPLRARRSQTRSQAPAALDGVPAVDQLYVAGPDMSLYHRADCVMARSRGWMPRPVTEQAAAGRTPCGVCQPGVGQP